MRRNVELAVRNLSTPSPRADHEEISRSTPYVGDESARPLKFQSLADASFGEDTKRFLQRTGETISKPMMLIGKIFAEALDGLEEPAPLHATFASRHYDGKSSPIPSQPKPEDASATAQSSSAGSGSLYSPGLTGSRTPVNLLSSSSTPRAVTPDSTPQHAPPMDFSAMQLEIDRAHEAANQAAHDMLKSIFPAVEEEVIDMILEATNGDAGHAIDQLLEMIS